MTIVRLHVSSEPHREKTGFLPMPFAYAKTKAQISFAVTAKLISAFVFATRIVNFLFFLNPKFKVSNHPLRLYRRVWVGPGRKSRSPVFSRPAHIANMTIVHLHISSISSRREVMEHDTQGVNFGYFSYKILHIQH